ncbi:MAG TPA: hypothetical protein VF491_17705 [Vicinamibacterales bacterium]
MSEKAAKDYTSTVMRMAGNIAAGMAPVITDYLRFRDEGTQIVIADFSVALARRIVAAVSEPTVSERRTDR